MDMDIKKNMQDREAISLDNDDHIKNPNVFNSVNSTTSCAFAAEANAEERISLTDAAGSAESDMAIKDRSKKQQINDLKQAMRMSLKSLMPHESILADLLVNTKHPGAMEIFPGGEIPIQQMSGTHTHGYSQVQLPETIIGVSDAEAPPPSPLSQH